MGTPANRRQQSREGLRYETDLTDAEATIASATAFLYAEAVLVLRLARST
jgi:hypothetical protein